MLGRFELQVGGVVVHDGLNRSRKMWNLLAYIVAHRGKAISQQEFIEVLWGDDNSQNPTNALKTLLYRIRLFLQPLEKAYGDSFILSQRGSYSWNPRIRCRLDTDDFEQLCRVAANDKLDEQQRIELYTRCLQLYRGDFLPKMGMEFWAIPLNVHYHALYLSAAKGCAMLLESVGHHAKMAEVCDRAIEIDNLDEELHCLKIRALIRQGKDAKALAHYEAATELLYRMLGVRPSEPLRALYLEIMKAHESLETDLSIIQEQLREVETEEGAFVCDYGFFKQIYRLEARRAQRTGRAVYVGLLTLTSPSGETPPLELLDKGMQLLLTSIRDCMRRGDVVSRYSGMQYVLLLSSLTYEDGERVLNRLSSAFYKQNHRYPLKLHYKFQQLEPYKYND